MVHHDMTQPLVAVTGANGTHGSEVVRQLAAAERPARAIVFTLAKAAFGTDVEVVHADLSRPGTLTHGFAGIDSALVVASGVALQALEAKASEAAKAAGVRHIVIVTGRHLDAPFLEGSILARWRGRSESRQRGVGAR
jgi:uncharacterized protein YbjT (DUF2867 family)